MKATSLAPALLLALALPLAACDDGHDHDDHGHDDHTGHGDETSDANTMVHWHQAPPATATVGEAFEVMFTISSMGDIHVREVRICEGADVADCGLGDMDSFTGVAATHDEMTGMDSASVTLDAAGDYTVVAYTHVGADPHVSDAVNVTAS